jgi:hypothetical protein
VAEVDTDALALAFATLEAAVAKDDTDALVLASTATDAFLCNLSLHVLSSMTCCPPPCHVLLL